MMINLGIKTSMIKPELMKKALIESAIIVQNDAKLNCPVNTGRLRGSISFALEDMSGKTEGKAGFDDAVSQPKRPMKAKIGTNVEYAIFVEYMKGNQFAFLRRAFFQNVVNIKNRFLHALKASMGKI